MAGVLLGTVRADKIGAWEPTGLRFANPCITHNDARIAEALALWSEHTAIQNCGFSASPMIGIRIGDPWLWDPSIGLADWSDWDSDGFTDECIVTLPPWHQTFIVILHEVGHCLGLGHSAFDDAVMWAECCNAIGSDDIEGIAALYGPQLAPRSQVHMALVSRE